MAFSTPMASEVNGTRCARRPFMRSAGMIQIPSSRLISLQRAASVSPVRVAVSTRNSRARADTLSCCWRSAMKLPIS